MNSSSVIEEELLLREFQPVFLDRDVLTEEEGTELHEHYAKQIDITWPSPRTDGKWVLRAKGYVGTIPLRTGRVLRLEPKVPVGSIFRMLEYAYDIDLNAGDNPIASDGIEDLYSLLAALLARRVLLRGRRGLHRNYIPEEGEQAYVRGRLDIRRSAVSPWRVRPWCEYQEHTSDVEENQILAWTLRTILRHRICRGERERIVRAAWNMIGSLATPRPFSAADCLNRLYTRVTEDYRPLHAICRFFLEQSGPTHRTGDHRMLPFLIDTATLFETFVVKWLQRNCGPDYGFYPQYKVEVGSKGGLSLHMDIVMRSETDGRILAVIDTKYKAPQSVGNSDAYQIHAYAAHEGCRNAILIYPRPLPTMLDTQWGESGIRVRSLAFDLEGDLERAGSRLKEELLSALV